MDINNLSIFMVPTKQGFLQGEHPISPTTVKQWCQ